jgi:hypothetical protein
MQGINPSPSKVRIDSPGAAENRRGGVDPRPRDIGVCKRPRLQAIQRVLANRTSSTATLPRDTARYTTSPAIMAVLLIATGSDRLAR